MKADRYQTAADPQTKPTDLNCESACMLLLSTPAITISFHISIFNLTSML